ncbi:AAA family ATPase [Bradyrhizobium sp. 41S5]|uniref:ATP-binding protein n=1 Tax=Bradyrhizobium sp. 41S5 TaxID=1404443 RepID=UPI00156B0523|nr:LuxR family transcriptional regulator [Bradyrhizobium sp. 41S5]UFX47566.1 AAA family ATPase [Bradyrhizobium sp. 41S5]
MTRRPIKAPRSERRQQDSGNRGRAASPVLYGREDDIAIIDGLLDRVRDGGAALLVSGEPGIGKTALLEVAQARAQSHGMRVLRLCGVTSEAHLPFGALHQAVGPMLKEAKSLPARQRSALQAAFGLSDAATAPDIFLSGLATLNLLTASAARRPILLLADDIQWLDQPSNDVLAFLSRRLSSDPIVLLMAIREGSDRSFPYSDGLRHRLSRLSMAAAERLLDAEAPDLSLDLRHRFLDEAAGNPLALVELPRGERRSKIGETPWLPLTDRLERAFLSRVSGLPTATRTLLLVIAENDSRLLREVFDAGEVLLGECVGLDVLAPAVSAMLIEIDETEVRFRHPLVRSAVHQSAGPEMRHDVRAALARVIKDQSDRAIWHRMASTVGPDDTLAEELDEAAARSQRRGALAMAILALENAARLSSTRVARTERLLRAAGFAADLGQPQTVERLIREADLDQTQPRLRARFAWVREIGQPLMVNDPGGIFALVRFAEDARADGANGLALNLLWRASQRCWWGNASDTVRTSILAAASELGFPPTDPRMIAIAGYAEPLKHGHHVYQQLSAHAPAGVANPVAAWTLGLAANSIGAFDYGVSWLTEASTALREQGRLGALARVLFARSFAETETGDWMGAIKSSAESIRLGEETGRTAWVSAATIVQARLAAMRGNLDAAEALVGHAERLVRLPGASFWLAMLQNARGIAALGAGRPAEAFEHLQRVHMPADPAFNTSLQFYWLVDYVEAAVSCGQGAAAAAVIDEVERRAAPMAVPWVRMMLSHGKALLASPARAEAFFQEGLGTIAQNWPFLRGRLLLAYGEWLRRHRRVMEARAPLRTARDILDALGALPWSDRARRELRAAGETSRPRANLVLDELTPQELQIAELAASGLSNKEIGTRLYLSHRTVGSHLYRIFPKLGITTRSGLRAALSRSPQSAT